jgi:hypothetical protein
MSYVPYEVAGTKKLLTVEIQHEILSSPITPKATVTQRSEMGNEVPL